MKNRKNENSKSCQRPQDMVNFNKTRNNSIPSLSPLSNFDRIQNMITGINQNSLLPSQHNVSPSISHTIREDRSFYGKVMDYPGINPSMQNLPNNVGLSQMMGYQDHDMNRKVNNSLLSYEQNDSILKSQKYSIQNGSSTFNFMNTPNLGGSHYLNPTQNFGAHGQPARPKDKVSISMNPLSTYSNGESGRFFFGNGPPQNNPNQAQNSTNNLSVSNLLNAPSHRGSKNYELSIAQDRESLADKVKLSMQSFGLGGPPAQAKDFKQKFKNEFGDDIYSYIKECIKRANMEIENEKKEKDQTSLTISHNPVHRETPSFGKMQEIQPSKPTPEFGENLEVPAQAEKKSIKLKIDFEPLGNRISPNEYPQIKQEVMKSIQKIGEKYAHVLNLELQIKDMIIPRQLTNPSLDAGQIAPVNVAPLLEPNQSNFSKLTSSNLFPASLSGAGVFLSKQGGSAKNKLMRPKVKEHTIAEKVTGKDKHESLGILKEELFNVLENSFDEKIDTTKKERIQQQIVESTFLILKNLNCSSEKEYYKENFFNFFNLQLTIDPVKINSFSLKMKIRIACLLFCKYVNRTKILSFFEDFYDFVDISDLESALRSIRNEETQTDPLARDEKDLWDLFYFRNFTESSREKSPQDLFSRRGIFLLRKLLILFIMLMDLCKSFLNLKTGEEIFKTRLSFDVHKNNHQKVKNILQNNNYYNNKLLKYGIDSKLFALPLEDLMAQVDVCFFQNYLLLTHVYLTKKFSKKVVNLRLRGKNYTFKFTLKEQEQIFCSKSKRRDELIKFSYKFIRKQIFKNFKKELFQERKDLSSNEDAKKEFYSQILNQNKEAIDYFNSVDVSKKHLKKFEKCRKIVDMIHNYKDNKYIEEQIETNIFKKAETIFRDDLTFENFLKCLFCGQHKHSVILQDIINSHNIFDIFFQI